MDWKRERETGTDTKSAFSANLTPEKPEQLPAKIQAQPRALVCAIRVAVELPECREERAYLLGPDSDPSVGYGYRERVTGALGLDDDLAAIGEFHGICREIQQNLKKLFSIGDDLDLGLGENDAKTQALRCAERLELGSH